MDNDDFSLLHTTGVTPINCYFNDISCLDWLYLVPLVFPEL